MDELAEVAGNLLVSESRVYTNPRSIISCWSCTVYRIQEQATQSAQEQLPGTISQAPLSSAEGRPMRRPMLNNLRQIDSIRDLAPFFSYISLANYESVYASGGNVDWDAIEAGIMDDMFDGR